MIRFYCDGCKNQISQRQALTSLAKQAEVMKAVPNMDVRNPVEAFCPTCLERASDWWTQVCPMLVQELAEQANGRIENRRKDFFRKLKAVENQGTAGSS